MHRSLLSRALLAAVVSFGGVGSWTYSQEKKDAPPADLPLEKLVELNAKELFGGEAKFKDGRVTLTFPGRGTFARGFRSGSTGGRGFISGLDDLKDPNMRGNLAGGLEAPFSFAGIEGGEALSKFELSDDFTISFRMRLPLVPPGASFLFRMHQEDAKSYLQTSFFQEIAVLDGGKPRKKTATDAVFSSPPAKWFIQKVAEPQATPVEIVFKDKKLSVFVSVFSEKAKSEKKEVVSLDGIEKPTSGKIFIKFSKLSFGIADFAIDGKYSRAWAEAEIARLRKEKKLRLRAEDPEPSEKKIAKPDVKGKRAPNDKKADDDKNPKRQPREKRKPPDVGQPDPEAEVDL